MTAKKTAAKTAAKKTAPKVTGECYAGDGPAVGTMLTAFGPRLVCARHSARAKAAGRVVR